MEQNTQVQKLIADFVGLKLPAEVSDKDIKKAFMASSRHDDVLKKNTAYQIAEAWEELSNPVQREDFSIHEVSPLQFLSGLKDIGLDQILEDGLDTWDLVEILIEQNPDLEDDSSSATVPSDELAIKLKMTTLGISFSIGDDDSSSSVLGNIDPSQNKPKGNYVYAHMDCDGNTFYIGKGAGKRAWSSDRHILWGRYVEKHLNGKYEVKILVDSLTADEAEYVESEEIEKYGDALVNWINPARKLNYENNAKYWELKKLNKKLIEETRSHEKKDTALAVEQYRQAISNIESYVHIDMGETGLVGQLLREDDEEFGLRGELLAMDRLTLCLKQLGRGQEAYEDVISYFKKYRRDKNLKMADTIIMRVIKAKAQQK